MIARVAFATIVVVAAVASTTSACGFYQTSDQPICGDKVLPDGDTCAVWPAPCGCPENMKCGLASQSASGVFTFACAAPGSKGIDAPCASDTECAKGTLCDGARCRRTCFEALDCGSDEAVACIDYYRDKDGNRLGGTCSRDCDPVSPQAPSDGRLETCRADETCIASINLLGGTLAACTRTAGKRTTGQSCAADIDCVSGDSCVLTGSSSVAATCARWCRTDDATSCPDGKKCLALTSGTSAFSVLGRALGACQ